MISHDYWLGAFVHSVGTRGKGSCLGQQIRRFKRCASTDDQIDGDLVILRQGGYLFFGNLVCILYLLRNSTLRFFGNWLFFEFLWEDTNVIRCIFWREFWFSELVRFWVLMVYFDPGIWVFDVVTRVLDFGLTLSWGYWCFFGEGISISYFEFWIVGICSKTCW